MRDSISGLLEDGPLIEMMFLITISQTSSLLITGSRTTACKDRKLMMFNFSLQNKLLLKVIQAIFDNERIQQRSQHEGFAGGVRTSENGIFLYKSIQSDGLIRSRVMDYMILFSGAGWLAGVSSLLLVPFLVATLSLPRKLAVVNYFTFHAELLPHTEQVVFHKADFFGKIRRIYVDIKNLEKIDADIVPSKLLWGVNMFDSNMVFRDMETREVFVFDSNGIWNEDALKHKLLF